jgi:hypothetical protein
VRVVTLVTTGQLATELGVSRSAVLKWYRAGLITPELITPGNHRAGTLSGSVSSCASAASATSDAYRGWWYLADYLDLQ